MSQSDISPDTCMPDELQEYIGCKQLVSRLVVAAKAAKYQNNAMPACFFYGGPGTGKTTLAKLIGKMRGSRLIVFNGSRIGHKELDYMFRVTAGDGDSEEGILSYEGEYAFNEERQSYTIGPTGGPRPTTVVIFDECEKIHKSVFQALYPTIPSATDQAFYYSSAGGKQSKYYVPAWTPVFITNYPEQAVKAACGLFEPGGRCSIQHHFDLYDDKELYDIIMQFARKNRINVHDDACMSLSQKANGTPRQALQLLNTAYAYLCASMSDGGKQSNVVTLNIANKALELDGIDEAGLSNMDRHYLLVLAKEKGNTLALPSLVAKMSVSKETVERIMEPKLVRADMVRITGIGRTLTEKGKTHIAYKAGDKIMPSFKMA